MTPAPPQAARAVSGCLAAPRGPHAPLCAHGRKRAPAEWCSKSPSGHANRQKCKAGACQDHAARRTQPRRLSAASIDPEVVQVCSSCATPAALGTLRTSQPRSARPGRRLRARPETRRPRCHSLWHGGGAVRGACSLRHRARCNFGGLASAPFGIICYDCESQAGASKAGQVPNRAAPPRAPDHDQYKARSLLHEQP